MTNNALKRPIKRSGTVLPLIYGMGWFLVFVFTLGKMRPKKEAFLQDPLNRSARSLCVVRSAGGHSHFLACVFPS